MVQSGKAFHSPSLPFYSLILLSRICLTRLFIVPSLSAISILYMFRDLSLSASVLALPDSVQLHLITRHWRGVLDVPV